MPGTVFVTGASGFVGSAVVEELLARGYSVNALVNRRVIAAAGGRVHSFAGGVFDEKILEEGMRGCAAVIHLIGIIFEHAASGITFERMHVEATKNVVDAAVHGGVKRYVHMSALGTRPDAVSGYHKTKYLAEQYVRGSGLDWTIFRPSMIHGPRGEFMMLVNRWVRGISPPFFAMPYFKTKKRGGIAEIQPIYVKDVARAFVDALEKPQTIGEIYPIAGPERFTWPKFYNVTSRAILGRGKRVLAIPAEYARVLAKWLPHLTPFNQDQVIMSQEDNTADLTKFKKDFGWELKKLEETVRGYGGQLR